MAETQHQAAHSAFVSGLKIKLNYFLRTIPNIRSLPLPLEKTIRNKSIPAVTGGHIYNGNERALISLPTRYGGLAVPIYYETVEIEFMNSNKIEIETKRSKEGNCKNVIERITTEMNNKEKRLVDISTQTGVSKWFTVLPITQFGFELSNQQFWDSIKLQYCLEITNLPTTCP